MESYVYNLFRATFFADNIKFWRTPKKQEIDFIISDLMGNFKAIEVKFNIKNFRTGKYKLFKEHYPKIPLQCLDIHSVLDYDLVASTISE